MSTETLKAYQVGDNDIVAAFTPEEAVKVLCEFSGYPDDEYSTDDVELVGDELLDSMQAFDEDEGKVVDLEKSLRQELLELTQPAYMYGWE